MRESAQRADSETTASGEADSCRNNSLILLCMGVPCGGREFPNAIQVLRSRPRHLVRFTALPRNTSLYSSSLMEASHSSLGNRSDSVSCDSSFTFTETIRG